MTAILELARMTFIEAIRNRIAYGILAFMVLLLATAALISDVTMGQTQMMILDMGLGGISIMGNLMAILFAIQSLQQERDSRALYVLLIRMAHRWQYVLGKFFGLAGVLMLMVVVMCALLAVGAYPFGHFSWISFIQAGIATVFETWMTIAVAMLFAQTSSLFLGVLLTLAIDIAGRFTSVIHHFSSQFHSHLLRWIIIAMYYVLPNFEAINLRDDAGYISAYSMERVVVLLAYSFSETAFILALVIWVFSRKNLT